MRTRITIYLTILLLLLMQTTFAQQRTVSGKVTDGSGLPLPGVSVLVKGTKIGTQTDFDGKFSINAEAKQTLVFSFIGMKTQELPATDAVMSVKMQDAAQELQGVVVTGYGIKRRTKDLAYATKNVEAKELVQAAPINAVTALAGKVSGLNIITRNNGVNPSTAIILRGYKSMTGSNAALIVIDGVIQPSTALDNLNPNDIISANVLKGASATTLYGSDGKYGAVIVTTKQGKVGTALEATYNMSYAIEQVKYFPELQTTFGPGNNNQYDPYENTSWGPRFDGQPRRLGPILADGTYQTVNYSAIKNNRRDFFVDGITTINGVSLSGGDEKSTFFFSAQRADITGITPNDKYTKDNFRLNASRKGENMKVSTNVAYFSDKSDVVGSGGYQNRGLYWSIINTPANVPLTSYKDWRNNPFAQPEGYYNEYYQNPYMLVDIARDNKRLNRLNANVKFDYDFNDWISASYTLAGTFDNSYAKNTRAAITYNPALAPTRTDANTVASVDETMFTKTRLNSDLLFKFERKLNESFKTTLILGNAVSTYRENQVKIKGDNLFVPDLYNPSVRTGELTGSSLIYEERKVGYFADLTIGYKDFLTFNGAYRYDQSSTLPLEANGFDFFTYGAALTLTDAVPALKSDIINFWKFNLSYASVGDSPDLNYINQVYTTPTGFPLGSTTGLAAYTIAASSKFSPSYSKSFEMGTEMDLFKKRVSIGINYYNSTSTDDFLSAGTSAASGVNVLKLNAGEMLNKGLEVDLSGTVLRAKDFEWKVGANFSKISNEVISLSDGAERLQTGLATSEVGVYAQVGQSFPSLYGTAYTRDDQGRVVIDANTGNPIVSSELKYLGATTPDFILGLNSTIKYKQFTLTAVADYKTGHVYYNNLVDALEFTGSTLHSVTSGRQPFIFPNSSYETAPGVYTANTNITTADGAFDFWVNTYNSIKENYVVDATTFKLREVALNYELPASYIKNTFIKSVSFGLVARNIMMLRSAQNKYTDPEFTNEDQQVTGFGTQTQLPPTASYGFKMDVKF